MRFEARDLKPYAEPISADELVQGETYFAVRYIDEEMLIPTIDTLVFIGRDLDGSGTGKLYFQDIGSYMQGVRYATASNDDGALFITEASDKPWIFRFNKALDQLLACAIRRKARGKEVKSEFVTDEACQVLSCTVRLEARDLKPYAEPISADELVEGEAYFAVRYIDEEMLIPTMGTLVFIGRDLDGGSTGELYFQDIDSYLQGVRYVTASEEDGALFITESSDKPWVFRFDKAVELLMKCSLRREAHGKV